MASRLYLGNNADTGCECGGKTLIIKGMVFFVWTEKGVILGCCVYYGAGVWVLMLALVANITLSA